MTKATRDAFGETIVEIGKKDTRIVVLSGDLEDATRAEKFKKEIPDRFFNMGISEQDMVSTAAGLSAEGFIPFACSFAVFLTGRACDQIRLSVCYNNKNVKLVGTHAGVTVGEDGGSAQALEDIALMRVMPNMSVVCPCDAVETKKAVEAITKHTGALYLRLGRAPFPVITAQTDPFEIGKANTLKEGSDVTLIGCGVMVSEALSAAELLRADNIDARVINMHTIKPVDEKALITAARETGAIVTAEEHQLIGGLGGAVSEVLARTFPVPIEMVGIKDRFGETGTAEQLLVKFHLKDVDIASAAKRAIARKRPVFHESLRA
ncbi:MAG: transketolase family protein [Endomicrobiales bacterium]